MQRDRRNRVLSSCSWQCCSRRWGDAFVAALGNVDFFSGRIALLLSHMLPVLRNTTVNTSCSVIVKTSGSEIEPKRSFVVSRPRYDTGALSSHSVSSTGAIPCLERDGSVPGPV